MAGRDELGAAPAALAGWRRRSGSAPARRRRSGVPPAPVPFVLSSSTPAAPSGSASPLTITPSAPTAAGAALLCVCTRTNATDLFTGLTDGTGNVWQQLATSAPGATGRRIDIWAVLDADPVAALSVAFGGAGAGTAFATLLEFTGQPGDLAVSADAQQRAATTTPAPVSTTPSGSPNVCVAACMANPNNVAALTPSGPYSMAGINLDPVGHGIALAYAQPAGVASSCSWTLGASSGSGVAAISLVRAP